MKTNQQHPEGPPSSLNLPPTDEEIAERAYELWSERGRPEGDSSADWFAARSQLASERALRAALTDSGAVHYASRH
jgi:Protein of unknown function (DUF2934)